MKNSNLLSNLRIVDFTRVVAGPFATRILADFGAEVIKIQSEKSATGAEKADGGYFATWNRNKKSATLDMDHGKARELAFQLIAISDVVVENFSPRVMKNWGLTYDRLKEVKKDLIMLSVSAMGQTGPWCNHVAFGPTVQSLGGFSHITAYDDRHPVGSGYAYADTVSGLYGAFSVLAALEHRDRTGQGMYIDLSAYEAACTLIAPTLMDAANNKKTPPPHGNGAGDLDAAPYGCYPCRGKDRWCVIAVFTDAQWEAFCHVLKNPGWTQHQHFSTRSSRKRWARELDAHISRWTSGRPAQEVVTALQGAGVPSGMVQNARDLANDPHLLKRGYFKTLEHPVLGETTMETSPIRMEQMEGLPWRAAPGFGQDNRYVFLNLLGLTESDYLRYTEQGIIR